MKKIRTAKILAQYFITCYMSVCILEIDSALGTVKHAFTDGVTLTNVSVSAVKTDQNGNNYFTKMGTTYYLSDFIKACNLELPIKT